MSLINHLSAESTLGRPPYVERVARAYINEGLALLGEGVAAHAIESAATEGAGMSMGPLALLDEWSLDEADRLLHEAEHHEAHDHDHGHAHSHDQGHSHDHGHSHPGEHEPEHGHTHSHSHDDAPDRASGESHRHGNAAHPLGMTEEAVYVLEKMAHGYGRMGRQSGRGFYDYDDEDAGPELWSGLKAFERRRLSIGPDDLRDRLLFVQMLESLRCLQEGFVDSTDAADESAVRDFGFPPSPGGPFALANQFGPAALADRARELATRYGVRFEPPPLLREHAERGEGFEGVPR